MSSLTASPAWQALVEHALDRASTRTTDLFAEDSERAQRLSCEAAGLYLDYSKQRVDAETLELLQTLARQQALEAWRERLFSGAHVNHTEDRAALHMALRARAGDVFVERGDNVVPMVHAERERMARFASDVREGRWIGATGQAITDVVNIGIGGSDLGPRMVCSALAPLIDGPRPHFVSNVDGADLDAVLQQVRPETTLFVIVSKTFSTQETLANAMHARAWLVAALGEGAVAKHFVAVSTHAERVAAFGIEPDHMFHFWDWVGGRYSVWSAVGLSIMLALGADRFGQLCAGARAMDEHFRTAPLGSNMPVLLALLTVWNVDFLGCSSHVMAAYAQRLALLGPWIQQLEMESNGKRVTRSGEVVDYPTTPVLWGTVGTNAQHAYFQMLHQGPAEHEIDFIAAVDGGHPYPDLHQKLLANCFAQSSALMRGKDAAAVREELSAQGLSGDALEQAVPHRVFPGNRPSNTILLPVIDPYHLGALLALYEHRTFVASVIWGINPFDQWGVELGKQLARQILDPASKLPLDPSTQALMARVRMHPGS
ncbi:MAG: glucose-6-phosphate isomerase [Nevskiales bacterium]|nr:glucose-6-phosphate isomerase [Nevskiales bacterium]